MRPIAAVLALAIAPALFGGSVPIVVEQGRVPAAYWPAPVKCGVPFPEGVLKAGDPIALVDEDGKAQPLQSAVTATWDAKGEKGVRWLLIDFAAERGRKYRLLFGPDAKAVPPQAHTIARMNKDVIEIDTGKLKASCGPTVFDLLRTVRIANRPSISADTWSGPYIEHEKRGLFRADLDKAAKVVLEETGPIRATVKADGWYANEAGEKFCRFSLRLHFFKGQSNIKVEHTFIFTGNSLEDRLRDVGFRVPLARTRHQHSYVMFGSLPDDGPMVPVEAGSSSDTHVYQTMDSPDHRRFEWALRNGATDRNITVGVKAAGVMRGNTDTVSLVTVIRDAWQQYPFELEWNRGDAVVHFWPRHGRLWDTSWDGIWYYLTDTQKRFMVRSKPKVDDKNLDAMLAKLRRSNACGAAKTHEAWLLFDVDSHWISLPMYHDFVHHPAYAHADLKWQCASKALDWVAHQPYDRVNFPNEEDFLTTALDIVKRHTDYVGYYGWWDWGAYHQFFNDGEPIYSAGTATFENTGNEPAWHRAKPKSHYLWGSLPWVQYMRTGDAAWLRYAQTYTLYALDRDTIHDGPGAGSEFPYDNSEVHWLGGWQGAPGGRLNIHNLLEKNDAIYQYWLTGDRRPLDVLRMWADQYDKAWSPKEVYYDAKQAFVGNNIRNTGGRLRRLVSYYEATWDERFRMHCKNLADVFPGAAVADQVGDATWFTSWMHEGLFRCWKVFGDPKIKESAIAYCRYQTDSGAGMFTGGLESGLMDWCTFGHELTGDTLYLDLGRRILDRQITPWASRDAFHPGAQKFRLVSMPRFMGAMANAPEAWRARNLPAHLNGVSLDYYFYDRYGPGDKMRSVLFLKETDAPFSVQFSSTVPAARFAVFGPDGRIAAREKLKAAPSARSTIEVPRDGQTGVYALRCLSIDDKSLPPGELPRLCILRCDLPKIAYQAPADRLGATFSARSWCVGVPAGADNARILWRPDYGTLRAGLPFSVSESGGNWRLSSAEMNYEHIGGGDVYRYTLAIPKAERSRVFRCGVDYRAHAVIAFPDGIGNALPSAFGIVGAPAWVSATPEAWFLPQPPKEYEKP